MYGVNVANSGYQVQTFCRGNYRLHVHKDGGNIWLKAVVMYGGWKNRVEEYLIAHDVKQGLFKLTGRVTHGSVPITMLARRHTKFPDNALIRMRVK